VERAGGVQKAKADGCEIWTALVGPAHRTTATIAKLLALLLVDRAEQVLRPLLMPPAVALAALFADGSWHVARGRTLPAWAEREVRRLAADLESNNHSFLRAAADALDGRLAGGFRRPEPSFPVHDDTAHAVVVEAFPEPGVDLSESDRSGKGLTWWTVVALDYRRDRFMRHLSTEQLERRLADIMANVTRVTDDGLVAPLTPGDTFAWWLDRFTEVMEEIALRYGPYPAGFVDGRIRPRDFPGSFNGTLLGTPRNLRTRTAPHPPPIVKYGRRAFLLAALERGALRVSPASTYLDSSLNVAIRDNELSAGFEYVVALLPPVEPPPPGISLQLPLPRSARIAARRRMPTNYYVFCASRVLEPRLLLDFDADCCLVVHDVGEFARRLQVAMSRALPSWSAKTGDVSYYDPLQVMPAEVRLPYSKHFRYAYQREFRIAWLPAEIHDRLDPIDVELGGLRDIAELVVPECSQRPTRGD
jgi:hypothetical protein